MAIELPRARPAPPCRLLGLAVLAIAAASGETFSSAGVQLHYVTRGEGEAVVLLHGFGGSAEAAWTRTGILEDLALRYHVIALDLRGHGQSGKPHTPRAYGAPMADDVLRLLDHLKIRKAHVLGYSMGGRLAMMLLAKAPGRLRTVVIGGAGWLDPSRLRARQQLMEQTALSLEQGKGPAPMIRALAPPGQVVPAEAMEAFNRIFMAGNDPLALAALSRGIAGFQPPESKMRRNATPVLALAGEIDPNRPDVERMDGLVPGVRIVILPGANHLSAVRHPGFLSHVKQFLAAHPDR